METSAFSGLSRDDINNLQSFLSSTSPIEVDLSDLMGAERSKYLERRRQGGGTLLHTAVLFSNAPAVKALLNLGANTNVLDDDKATPLHFASDVVIAQSLIDHGADIDAKDQDGETILSLAFKMNNIALVHFLLNHKADFSYAKQQCRVRSGCTEEGFLDIMMYGTENIDSL